MNSKCDEYRGNSKGRVLCVGQNWFIFITGQALIKINEFEFMSGLGKKQNYSGTVWAKLEYVQQFSIGELCLKK